LNKVLRGEEIYSVGNGIRYGSRGLEI
jgi:hypothetical protein